VAAADSQPEVVTPVVEDGRAVDSREADREVTGLVVEAHEASERVMRRRGHRLIVRQILLTEVRHMVVSTAQRSRMDIVRRITVAGITATGAVPGDIPGATGLSDGIGAAVGDGAGPGGWEPAWPSDSRWVHHGDGDITPITIRIGYPSGASRISTIHSPSWLLRPLRPRRSLLHPLRSRA
jgi:hypothetical protein